VPWILLTLLATTQGRHPVEDRNPALLLFPWVGERPWRSPVARSLVAFVIATLFADGWSNGTS